jgi:hypothetical protein
MGWPCETGGGQLSVPNGTGLRKRAGFLFIHCDMNEPDRFCRDAPMVRVQNDRCEVW